MKRIRPSINDIQNICLKLNLTYIDFYYETHDTVIKYICNKHPTIGVQFITWSHLKNARFACRVCCGKYKSTQEFILGNPQINKNVHILGEYSYYDVPILCECNDCGYKWKTTPASLRTGSGCPECGKIKSALSRRTSHEDFIKRVYSNNPNIEVISTYSRLNDPITCMCKIDGTIFTVSSARNLLYENVQCPFCSTSKSEQELMKILNECNYNYEFHYKFDDCKYIHVLEFDFAIFKEDRELLCLIEYDGEQHYIPIDFAGRGREWAEKQLQIIKTRDNIKTQYCYLNNIPLIRIPYWERNHMKEFLLKQINSLLDEVIA